MNSTLHVYSLYLSLFISIVLGADLTNAEESPDGHFSPWDDVPQVIESISTGNYIQPLQHLRNITRITLGSPPPSEKSRELKADVIKVKKAWQRWWQTTGKPIATEKKQNSQVDPEAFSMAWKFLGTDLKKPRNIIPVWIPKTWTLCVTFTNGDYSDKEQEVWIIQRGEKHVNMLKLRGDYSHGDWKNTLAKYDGFSLQQADQTLKSLCYLHRYAPSDSGDVSENEMKCYYPGATLHLHTGDGRLLWNVKGYDFKKTRQQVDLDESGRSYYFLNSIYKPDDTSWHKLSHPTSSQLKPYRELLLEKKPYFFANAPDIISLFSQYGQEAELESMLNWANKQKAAIDPNMNKQVHSDEFGHALKVNVINFTRFEFKDTVQAINLLGKRLKLDSATVKKIKTLNQDVIDMLALQKKEEDDDINRHPQPLRDLIRTDRLPNDSDLKHLKTAIAHIRKNPDPELFKQLVSELDDGTVKMRTLLQNILFYQDHLPGLQPWDKNKKPIAIHACIDALPAAQKIGEMNTLIAILLRASGGGKLEIADGDGGRSIQVKITKDGYSTTYGGASNPISIKDAQKKLRALYTEFRGVDSP